MVRRTGWVQLVTEGDPRPCRNTVLHSVLAGVEADAAISKTVAANQAVGARLSWHLSPLSSPDDLQARLESAGFEATPVRYFAARPAAVKPKVAKTVTVEAIDADNQEAFLQAACADQPHAGLRRADLEHLLTVDGYRFFMASLDGVPAATGGTRIMGRAAWLFGARTAAALQGNKAYEALTAARLEDLRSTKASSVYAVAPENGAAQVLDRLGLESAGSGAIMIAPDQTAHT
ncbi:MAG: hypothetical protein ACI9WU_000978 [Myxococcota bacterium]|jgi:hypothetical protein